MKAMGLQPQRLPTGAKSYVAPGEGALRRWIRTEVVRESPVFREKPTLERRLAGGNLQLGQPDTNRCSRAEKTRHDASGEFARFAALRISLPTGSPLRSASLLTF
jgi:hypothetical protein